MRIIITPEGQDPHEADQAELAGSPHRQISHALIVPNEPAIAMPGMEPDPVPPFTTTTYHTEPD